MDNAVVNKTESFSSETASPEKNTVRPEGKAPSSECSKREDRQREQKNIIGKCVNCRDTIYNSLISIYMHRRERRTLTYVVLIEVDDRDSEALGNCKRYVKSRTPRGLDTP